MAITVSGTSITFNDATTQSTAPTGTVSSVATGNGLSGGTITSTGTLVVACPTFNSVGSYAMGVLYFSSGSITAGNNYSAGGGSPQVQCYSFDTSGGSYAQQNILSGTWKWMAGGGSSPNSICGVICRVA